MSVSDRISAVLRLVRFAGALGMLGVVVAGALGVGETEKLWVAGSAAIAALIAAKLTHLMA